MTEEIKNSEELFDHDHVASIPISDNNKFSKIVGKIIIKNNCCIIF